MTDKKPRAGFGIMIMNKEKQILLGKRHDDPEKASSLLHGEGTWTFPGGKLDFGETLQNGVCREVKEETDIELNKKKLKLISLTDEIVTDAHFVTAGFLCQEFRGSVKVMEPDEITEWKWFNINNLPKNIFVPTKNMINNYLAKKIYDPKE